LIIPVESSEVESLIVLFILILSRITPVICFKSINPLSMLPAYLKVVVSLIITLLVMTSELIENDTLLKLSSLTNGTIIIAIFVEFFIGLVFWFSLLSNYGSLITMLKLLDTQVGFNPMGIFNPSTSESDPTLARVVLIFASLMFFISGFHYSLIELLIGSLSIYPVLSGLGEWSVNSLIVIFTSQFLLALLIVLPVVMAIFWVELVLGMCNRMMPQVNIYFVGQPVKILISLIVLSYSSTHILDVTERMFNNVIEYNYSLF